MKSKQKTEFVVDKAKNQIRMRRAFKANRQLVWNCYTKSELLDRWFAPKPFTTKTKSMNFEEGGHWHYAMIDPDGQEYWGLTKYVTIQPIDFYTTEDAFSNEKGEVNDELPTSTWKVTFIEQEDSTMVETIVEYESLQDVDTVISMGMEEGMYSTLERLDELLENIQQTNNANTIQIQTSINADLKTVWAFYTEPKHIKNWNFADSSWHCPSATNDLRVGGKLLTRMEAKDGSEGFDFEATYTEVELYKLLTYVLSDGRHVSVHFKPEGEKVTVETRFEAEKEHPMAAQKEGWQSILNQLKQYVEQ